MGVYIKGMEMPIDKAVAVVIHPDGTAYTAEMFAGVCTEYLSDCTAVSVPAHGDLIDYNFCVKNFELLHDDDGNPVYAVRMRELNAAPAIIEAEEGEP